MVLESSLLGLEFINVHLGSFLIGSSVGIILSRNHKNYLKTHLCCCALFVLKGQLIYKSVAVLSKRVRAVFSESLTQSMANQTESLKNYESIENH